MCGTFTIASFDELLQVLTTCEFHAPCNLEADWPATARKVRPGSSVPILTAEHLEAGDDAADFSSTKLQTRSVTWGYVAPFSNKLVYNARVERAFSDLGMWERGFRNGRVLIAARSFVEAGKTFAGTEALLMAGICESGRLALVTREADEVVSSVHPRMPLLLDGPQAHAWLASGPLGLTDDSPIRLSAQNRYEAEGQLSLFS